MHMKKSLLLIFFLSGAAAFAQDYSGYTVDRVNVSTVRMNPAVVRHKFPLKPGETFTPEAYDKAQDKLHDMRVFKELNFTLMPKPGRKVDVNIDATDGYYIFPIAFVSGGQKSVAALSLAEGNLFKQGETAFMFVGGSSDGVSASAGVNWGDNFLQMEFNKLNANQRFYKDYWSNDFGIFSTTDDEDEYNDKLLGQVHVKKTEFSATYARQLTDTMTVYARPEFIRYSYKAPGFDGGSHNQVTAGVRFADDIRKGANMGALSGYGLTDKKKSLLNLPRTRYGYVTDLYYTNGGGWTGADYTVSKAGVNAIWTAELRQRHMLILGVKGQDAFKASFSDEILSTDLLSGQGRYDRLIRGERGAGANASFIYYLLRNNTGLLSVTPFYETAWVYAGGGYRNHSGAGGTLAYKLWRFPFPLGLNYTHNLTDGSNQVSFVLGGAF